MDATAVAVDRKRRVYRARCTNTCMETEPIDIEVGGKPAYFFGTQRQADRAFSEYTRENNIDGDVHVYPVDEVEKTWIPLDGSRPLKKIRL